MPAVIWRDNEHHDAAKARTRVKAEAFFRSLDAEERHYLIEAVRHAVHSSPTSESNVLGLLHDLGLPREKPAGEA